MCTTFFAKDAKMTAIEDVDGVLAGVAPRLRAARKRSGLTLESLSRRTEISVSVLSRLESGKRRPTLELLLPLAGVYGIALDDLVGAPMTGDPSLHLRPHRSRGTTVIPLVPHPERVWAFKQVIAPQRAEPELSSHAGHQWICVLTGRLRLILDGTESVLDVGEIAEFDTHIPHWFGSADRRRVELLCLYGPDGQRTRVRSDIRS